MRLDHLLSRENNLTGKITRYDGAGSHPSGADVPENPRRPVLGVTPAYLESRIARRIKYSDSIDSQSVLKK